jgi:hypothetical protein
MQYSHKKPSKSVTHTPKQPKAIYTYPDGAAVYSGAVPPSAAESAKPLIVFVPGLGQVASSFWNGNSMYVSAYSSGFRTAFVSFPKPDNLAQDMWRDGEMLARQLRDICSYFNVQSVVIAAHSKGGVDSQTAAVHFGAADCIDNIITLSTPHHGSQLADIAYSTVGWPLAELLNAHSPGCYSMQTGYMRAFRNLTDESPKNTVPIKTFAGNGGENDPWRIIVGSLILSRFGENDGVVTVESAHNPKGTHMGTLHLNHSQMADGRYVWSYLDSVLEGEPLEPAVAVFAPSFSSTPAQIIKGGEIGSGVNECFWIDSTVESFKITIIIAGGGIHRRFAVLAPDGRKSILTPVKKDVFTYILKATVSKPQVGKWKLLSRGGNGAYCAVISLFGKNVFAVRPENTVNDKLGADMRILRTYIDGYDVVGEYSVKNGIELPEKPQFDKGIYNVEMNIKGELDDGSTYERTVLRPASCGGKITECENRAIVSKHK